MPWRALLLSSDITHEIEFSSFKLQGLATFLAKREGLFLGRQNMELPGLSHHCLTQAGIIVFCLVELQSPEVFCCNEHVPAYSAPIIITH